MFYLHYMEGGTALDRHIGTGPIMASIGSRAYLYYVYNSSDIDLGVVGYLARQISEFRHCCIFWLCSEACPV